MGERLTTLMSAAELRRKLGTGTMSAGKYLEATGVWSTPAGGGGSGQTAHANLTAFSGLTLIADRLPYANGTGTLALTPFTAGGRALAGVTGVADRGVYFTSTSAVATFDITAKARAFQARATAALMLTELGVSDFVQTFLDDADAPAVRTTIGAVALSGSTSTGEQIGPSFAASGKTGATATTVRLAGGTASGAPSTGAHVKGELVTDDTGKIWFCTVAGTPGTWVQSNLVGLGTSATVDTGTTSGKVPLLGTGGLLAMARMASGTPDGTKVVYDDGVLRTPVGSGREMGYAERVTGVTSTNTTGWENDKISSLSVVVVGTGRAVEIDWGVSAIRNSVGNWMFVGLVVNNVAETCTAQVSSSASKGITVPGSRRKVLTNGVTYTFEIGLQCDGGTSIVVASAALPIWIAVTER